MIDETLREADQKMEKAVEVAKEDFAAIRTGRAHPAMFAKITADYYGTPTPLQQLASFTGPEPRIDPDHAVRQERDARHREGDPRLRPRREPDQRRQPDPRACSRADRGAPQGVHQGRQGQGRGRPRCPSATSAARPRRSWTSSTRTARSARTRSPAPRRSSTALTKKHVDADRRAAQAQGSRAARGLSSRLTSMSTLRARRRACPEGTPSRAGRNLPVAIAFGVVLGAVIIASLVFWKPAFLAVVRPRSWSASGRCTRRFAGARRSGPAAAGARRCRGDDRGWPTSAGRWRCCPRWRSPRSPYACGGCARGRPATCGTPPRGCSPRSYVPFLAGFVALMLGAAGRGAAGGDVHRGHGRLRHRRLRRRGAVRQAPDGAADQPEEVLGGLRRLGRAAAGRRLRSVVCLLHGSLVGGPVLGAVAVVIGHARRPGASR